MEFIVFITDDETKRQFLDGSELDYAFIFKKDSKTIIVLEEGSDLRDEFTIKCRSDAMNDKAYDRVCDAYIRHSNIIDLRGIACQICIGNNEI